jgi:DNA-binding transcriptional MerR regulator
MTQTRIYTTGQLIEAVERRTKARLHRRTLSAWAEKGALVPSVCWPKRRRAARLYNAADVDRACAIARSQRHGMSVIHVLLIEAQKQVADLSVAVVEAKAEQSTRRRGKVG